MTTQCDNFATDLADNLIANDSYKSFNDSSYRLQAVRTDETVVSLDLRPFAAVPQPVTAAPYFSAVKTVKDLIGAYEKVRQDFKFEQDIPAAILNVSRYAEDFLASIFSDARANVTNHQARLIARWVSDLDAYAAAKAVESLLNSVADLSMLEISAKKRWTTHFDHLAIRCGSSAHGDAERVVEMLTADHGYVSVQSPEQAFYQFPDGWNAYPLYKILENGQVLRLFIDQSEAHDQRQIIQHWNRVYGYTAHHLAIRATHQLNGGHMAVPLEEVMAALDGYGIKILTPTGHYTNGLLLQVFTQPQRHGKIPDTLRKALGDIDPNLNKIIENAKLLELVSRKEMPAAHAEQYYRLYGLPYEPDNPLHSAPIYQYFLPAQAAHVIQTSIETG